MGFKRFGRTTRDHTISETIRPVFRFAPSPNGYLHLGHALSALINFELASRTGGRFLLRIEDTDIGRSRPEFVDAIYEDLSWLGLTWEEPVRQQSDHFADYDQALKRLVDEGLVYKSTCSRRDLNEARAAAQLRGVSWPVDPDGAPLPPPNERAVGRISSTPLWRGQRDYALRLHMDAALQLTSKGCAWRELASSGEILQQSSEPGAWGDIVLVGRDRPAAYHLAVVVDDALQGITHVVRGSDLYAATSVQCLLQQLLGLSTPVYHHHRLVLDEEQQKLSKSNQSTSLRELRQQGATPSTVRQMMGLGETDVPSI